MNTEAVVNGKVLLEQNVPIEEMLGSVTTYNNVEGSDSKSQQVRTSARVFKKMKLDSANAISNIPEKKVEPVKEEAKQEVKKPFRPLWSPEDKNLFFEALNEFGKDFEAIHVYISNKLKKKGFSESIIKTKDQVRHLYYRTWHKISKHLKFSEDLKKLAQELYGLINYGELRRKAGSVSEKTCMKLNELIYTGTIAIRVKGKTVRVKTPMCRALRKLNQLDEKQDDLRLPTRIVVELKPKDMHSWIQVQEVSQNPRVKAILPLQKRLSSFLNCMSQRWKSLNAVEYEKALLSTNNVTSDCVPDKKVTEEVKAILDPPFRLIPPSDKNIELPKINLSEYLKSHSICLSAYEERVGVKISGFQLWQNMYPCKGSGKGSSKKGTKRSRNDSSGEKAAGCLVKQFLPTVGTDSNENCVDWISRASFSNVVNDAVNNILSLKSVGQEINDLPEEKTIESVNIKVEVPESDTKEETKESDFAKIRNGWTINDCGTISIGELYLMFGSDSKLVLEYCWDHSAKVTPKVEPDASQSLEPTTAAETLAPAPENAQTNTNSSEPVNCKDSNNDMAKTLQKLLSVAKLHYRKNMVHCPCGHVCGSSSKNNCTNKNKTASKNTKTNTNEEKNSMDTQEKNSVLPITNKPKPTVPIVIQPHIRQFSPAVLFRRPNSPGIEALRAQLDSIQRLKPRYCNRRGRRPRVKQVVVERKLPLLPNKTDNSHQIVQMNIISQDSLNPGVRTIAPKILDVQKAEHSITATPGSSEFQHTTDNEFFIGANLSTDVIQSDEGFTLIPIEETDVKTEPSTSFGLVSIDRTVVEDVNESVQISDNAVTPSRVGSPTSISNLLDMALTGTDGNDIILNNTVTDSKDGIRSFVGLLENIPSSTPPSSPSRILKENENQWLNSEVADFSLSSFLGHLESPVKPIHSAASIAGDDTRLSQDVDTQLHSLLMESSVDYMAKFADLAAQMTSDSKK